MISTADNGNTEITHVFYGEEDAMKILLQTMVNVKREAVVCADANSAAFLMEVELVNKGYIDFKRRNIKIRFITQITSDNLPYIKDLMNYAEVRHMDIVKGNMAISETESVSTATLNSAKPVTQTIYSNAQPIVEQQRYFFENLWTNAMPVEERIKELEGIAVRVETRAVRGGNEILQETLRMVRDSNEYYVSSPPAGLLYAHNYAFDTFTQVLNKSPTGEHRGIRWITNLEEPSQVEVAEKFARMGMEIRHAKNLPLISFGISDKEMGLTVEKMENGKLTLNAIFSNEPEFKNHFRAIFDELWNQGQDLSDRVNEIMSGNTSMHIDVIHDPYSLQQIYDDLVESAHSEIKLVLPTTSAFLREEKIGIIQSLIDAANRGVQVSILTPTDNHIEPRIEKMLQKQNDLEVRQIRKSLNVTEDVEGPRSKILVVDNERYLVIELKDDSKATFVDAIRLGIYSNSRPTVLSYTMLFDSLWNQADLYEQLERHDRMQKEFINIAAHELRTPIQPILGTANLMESEFRSGKDKIEVTLPEVDILIRNANRLERLSSNILDVARIESNSLKLEKSSFNLSRVTLMQSLILSGSRWR